MVWIVNDDAMEHLLGGDFIDVSVLHEDFDNVSIRKMYGVQDVYKSYQGFRKFFKRHLEPIIEKISFIEDNGFIGRIIRYISGM